MVDGKSEFKWKKCEEQPKFKGENYESITEKFSKSFTNFLNNKSQKNEYRKY